MEQVSSKVCAHLNQYNAATLLLIAWNIAKRPDTALGQIAQVDRLGFELRCHYHGGKYSEERVNFPCGPIDNGKTLVDYIVNDLRRAAGWPVWPRGPLLMLVLLFYSFFAAVYFESHGGNDLTFLPAWWAPHMPTRGELHIAVAGLVGTNIVMALTTCFVLTRLKLIEGSQLMMWFVASITLGYPVWSQVLTLKRANTQGRLKRL
jgi:hypothetical protein